MNATAAKQAIDLAADWGEASRWSGIAREYTAEDVIRLQGSVGIEQTLARRGAEKLWRQLHEEDYVAALGALTGGQAVQMVRAGLKAIYLSGWQVAADGNLATQVYPDQSLYPANSVPAMVRRLNNALLRADQIDWAEGRSETDWLVPIVADAEAGFGGPLNAFELMKGMIEAGAAAVHFEDQLAAEKKCGHLGGKVLVPTRPVHPHAARGAARGRRARRADAGRRPHRRRRRHPADERRRRARPPSSSTGERTPEGFFCVRAGVEAAIARGLAYAPYADIVWCETSTPDLGEAREFAEAIHAEFPGKLLAYNCSPSFNWKRHLDDETIATFQQELGGLGLPLPVRHARRLPRAQRRRCSSSRAASGGGHERVRPLQEREFALEEVGYTATRHQREVGAGYFDDVAHAVSGGDELDARADGVDGGGAVRAQRRRGLTLAAVSRGPSPGHVRGGAARRGPSGT